MITQNYVTLVPAYGRDYTNAKAAKADFLGGKDFFVQSFGQPETYCTVRDFAPGLSVNLRFRRLMGVTSVKVPARS